MTRVHSLDYLKLLLAIGVVIGHSGLLQIFNNAPAFLLGNGLLRLVVPVFAIVSGYLFYFVMARGRVLPWLARIGLFYFAGMLIHLPLWFNPAGGLHGVLGVLFWGYYQLWFLAALLVAGTLIVILRFLGASLGVMALLAALLMGAGIFMQIGNLEGAFNIPLHRFRNGFTQVFPCMVLGSIWASWNREPPPMRVLLPALAFSLVLLFLESWVVLARFGINVMLEIPASTLVAAPLVFLVTLKLRLPKPSLPLGMIAAAIYLLHILFGVIVWKFLGGGPVWVIAAGILLPTALVIALEKLSGRSRKIHPESAGYAARHS